MLRYCVLYVALVLLALLPPASGEEANPYLAGEFKVTRVVDGDTIAVEGLPETIRFLCIDTEECETGRDAEQRTWAIAREYGNYVRRQSQSDPFAKFSTPMGWEAKTFAEAWFPLGSTVRVEYDSLSRKTGYYGRVLGYVFARRDGRWVNYNVECVRAGLSPYYEKYGASERFEADFLAAEREARVQQRGIWSPYAMAYPNYDERIAWWSRRGGAMKRFEAKYGAQENAISVLDEDDWKRLRTLAGRDVLLFGTVDDVLPDASPGILEMHHKNYVRLGITIADPRVFQAVEARRRPYREDFVYVRGTLAEGFERQGRTYVYRLPVESPEQFFVDLPAAGPAAAEAVPQLSGDEIPWQKAPEHMGEEVVVVGRIIRTNNIGRHTFLNFHDDYQTTLTLVVHEESYGNFPRPAERMYEGRTVRVRGKVTEYESKPQIVLTGPEQIDILE